MKNYERYKSYTEKKYNRKTMSYFLMKSRSDKELLPLVKKIRRKKILEVGPGYGYYTRHLIGNGNVVRGVDINPELGQNIGIEIVRGHASKLRAVVHDRYDYVLSFFMTEYLNERELYDFICQGIELLNSQGTFATTVIINRGLGWLYITLAHMKGIQKYCYSEKKIKEMLGEENKVRIIPLNTIFNIPFAILVKVER